MDDADDVVNAIRTLSEIAARAVVALERIEEKLDDLLSEAKENGEFVQAGLIGIKSDLRHLSAIASNFAAHP